MANERATTNDIINGGKMITEHQEDVSGMDGSPIPTCWHISGNSPSPEQKSWVAEAVAKYIRRPKGLAVPRARVSCNVIDNKIILETACLKLAEFNANANGKLRRLPIRPNVGNIVAELLQTYDVDTPFGALPEFPFGRDGLLTTFADMVYCEDGIDFLRDIYPDMPLEARLREEVRYMLERATESAIDNYAPPAEGKELPHE